MYNSHHEVFLPNKFLLDSSYVQKLHWQIHLVTFFNKIPNINGDFTRSQYIISLAGDSSRAIYGGKLIETNEQRSVLRHHTGIIPSNQIPSFLFAISYIKSVQVGNYDKQRRYLEENLLELLEQICSDENLTVNEKRRRLKKVCFLVCGHESCTAELALSSPGFYLSPQLTQGLLSLIWVDKYVRFSHVFLCSLPLHIVPWSSALCVNVAVECDSGAYRVRGEGEGRASVVATRLLSSLTVANDVAKVHRQCSTSDVATVSNAAGGCDQGPHSRWRIAAAMDVLDHPPFHRRSNNAPAGRGSGRDNLCTVVGKGATQPTSIRPSVAQITTLIYFVLFTSNLLRSLYFNCAWKSKQSPLLKKRPSQFCC